MNVLHTILNQCVEKDICPEGLLELEPATPLSEVLQSGGSGSRKTEISEKSFYAKAVQRFPKVLTLYISLAGIQAAKTVGVLTEEILEGNRRTVNGGKQAVITLYEAGISLSWWMFGAGSPMRTPPKLEMLSGDVPLTDYIRTLRFKQGWSDLESRWLITQTHESSQHKLTHRVISRVMTGMPRITLFPLMPDVVEVYKRIVAAVAAYEPDSTAEPWLVESVQYMQASPWRVCVLLLVRQGSISHWSVVGQQPRRKTERLAYVISLLLDLYGEHDGLTYYLRVLNEEAISLGFLDLAEVVRGAVWNIHLESRQKD